MVKRNDRKFDIRVNRALIKTCVTTLSTCFSPETEEKLDRKSRSIRSNSYRVNGGVHIFKCEANL